MREIFFRGFHPDKNGTQVITVNGEQVRGEWVYGYYVKNGEDAYILTGEATCINFSIGSVTTFENIQVIPETVGQYTGLKDKNGKKIFEGDVLQNTSNPTWALQLVKYGYCKGWVVDDFTDCFDFNEGFYGNLFYYKLQGYTILKWSDFMEKKEFTKADLKDGMVVEYRRGSYRILVNDAFYTIYNSTVHKCAGLLEYKDNLLFRSLLTSDESHHPLDIMRVYTIDPDGELTTIYERQDPEPMTHSQIEKALGKKFKYVADGEVNNV